MLVNVSMAKGVANDDNAPESFGKMFDIYLPGCRRELGKEGFTKLFWRVVDMVSRPYVMACGKEPKIGRQIWNFDSHDVGWTWLDFENENRLWIRVGVVESEIQGGFQ